MQRESYASVVAPEWKKTRQKISETGAQGPSYLTWRLKISSVPRRQEGRKIVCPSARPSTSKEFSVQDPGGHFVHFGATRCPAVASRSVSAAVRSNNLKWLVAGICAAVTS